MRPGSAAGPTKPLTAAEQAQLKSKQITEREREITEKLQRELMARGSASFREAAMTMSSQPPTVATKKPLPAGLPKAPATSSSKKAPVQEDDDEEDEEEDEYDADDFENEEQDDEEEAEEEAEEEEPEEEEEDEEEEDEEEEEEEEAPRKKLVTVKLVRSGDAALKTYDINVAGINSKTFKDLVRKISAKCATDPKTTVLKSLDTEGDMIEIDDASALKHLLKAHMKSAQTSALRIFVGDAKNPISAMSSTMTSPHAAVGQTTINAGGSTVTARAVNHFAAATAAADAMSHTQTNSGGTMRGLSGFFDGTVGSSATTSSTIVMPNAGTLQWTKMKLLGKGSFGTVNEGITNDGKLMAVKMVELPKEKAHDENDTDVLALRSEISLMTQLKHPHIVAYYGCQTIELENGNHQFEIFMEHCHGGSLTSLRKKFSPKDGKLKIGLARHYTRQILQGLKYLHEHQVIHRDIKSDNVLISASGEAKLADFGCSKRLSTAAVEAGAQTVVGSPLFMAPEVLTGTDEGYSFSADVWSVGCLLLELLGRKPWALSGSNAYQLMFQISQSKTMPTGVPENCPPKLKDFFARVFDRDATKRASAKELLDHPWMTCPDAELEEVEPPTDSARSDIK